MNVHVGSDDKFIDYVIDISKKVECSRVNKFIIFKSKEDKGLKYVKSKEIEIVNLESEDFVSVFDGSKYHQITHLYVHFFNRVLYPYLNKLPKHVQVVWCFWGEDGFGLQSIRKSFLHPKSIVANNESLSFFFRVGLNVLKNPKKSIRFFLNERTFRKNNIRLEREFTQAVQRVDWFAHFILEDYLILKRKYDFKAQFLPFSYASIESILNFSLPDELSHGSNVLLGNSASYMNNHLAGLKAIRKCILPKGAKLYCPLNYSTTSHHYTDKVIKEGEEIFKDSFVPLTSFILKEEYQNLLFSCSYAVMPHYRSQAWGNIMALLWNGSAVFLSRKSSLFRLLKDSFQVYLYCIEDDLKDGVVLSNFKLTKTQVLHNRNMLLKYVGEEKKRTVIREFLNV